MKWETSVGKNGEATLSLNGIQLYSRYRPREDARAWIEAHFDSMKSSYLLIGLGLGYHAERLVELAGDKEVHIYYFDEYEKKLCSSYEVIKTIEHIDFTNCQILIPNVWLKALKDHPILPYLEDIKIHQMTFKKSEHIMAINFEENVAQYDMKPYPLTNKKIACLVASGPSLNNTIGYLKMLERDVDIYVVGSALKVILSHNIVPTAVCISDCKKNVQKQLENTSYDGPLLFLSTANAHAVKLHKGPSYMLCQNGYAAAEQYAKKANYPLLETGGSVSTVLYSYLEYCQYEHIIFFGQDFAFVDDYTHAKESTSGRTVINDINVTIATANDGSKVYTTPNLQTYARWFKRKLAHTNVNVYTVSAKGLTIESLPFLTKENMEELLEDILKC